MKYILREMEKKDIALIVNGELKAFGRSLGEDFFIQELDLNPYSEYIVLEIEGIVHGYVGLLIHDTIEIINLYVDSEYQGMGFGSLLMDFVIDVCVKSKAPALSLEVRPSNFKAIGLYKKFELKEVAKRKQYYEDGEDAILMVRDFSIEG